jgi:hemin uptake protein HemP
MRAIDFSNENDYRLRRVHERNLAMLHATLLDRPETAARNVFPSTAPAPVPRSLDSRALLGGAHEVRITHAGQEYRLRLTRNDKLILTK